jgi:small subunit ribosomal protein S8
MTGRVRAVLPYFKLSRIEFRQLAKQNYFMGVKKSSWLVVISNIVELWIMNIPVVLSSLRNAGLARKPFATVPLSKLNINLLDLLYAEGFISGYSIHKHRHQIRVRISYLGIELPLVSSLKLVSRPGLRTYVRYAELVKCYSGRFLILSTRLGLVTGTAAITNRCGGELYALRYYFLF